MDKIEETAPSDREQPPAPFALAGLRVVVLGQSVAPAFAGRWLAAFGAAVTVVEPPQGHWARRFSPAGGEFTTGAAPLSDYLFAGASSVPLDPASPEDRATLRDLLADSDILLHDLDPDALTVWDYTPATLRAEYPTLVQVALLPFGSDGPYAGYAATSLTLLALGGYQYLTGKPGREPLMLPGFQPEYLTALYGISAALAGLHRRNEHGDGSAVEISVIEALASLHQFTTSQWLYGKSIRTRHGNYWENLYPITMLPCADGYLAMSMPSQEMWERLCLMIERPDLIGDERYLDNPRRHARAAELDAIIAEWMRDKTVAQLVDLAQLQWRLPVNPYMEIDTVLDDPQYAHRGYWVRPGGVNDTIRHPGMPVLMSDAAWQIRPAPALGASTPAPPAPPPAQPEHSASTNGAVHRSDPVLPLAGLRVLDFTRVWSGPLCTRILADLGADVIKVDAPFARNAGLQPEGARPTAGLGKLSRNKRSISIDLGRPEGRELVKRLAAECDILVENFSARVMPNFGLGWETLSALNPRLIMLSMSGYGATGPYRDFLCYGSSTEAQSGMTPLLGYPDEEPVLSAIAYPDAVAGLSGAAAVLTALQHRQRSGRGQFIDLSQIEPATSMWGESMLAHQQTGIPHPRTGNRHPYWAPHGTFRCRGADEWVSLAVRSDDEWQRFRAVTGLPDDPAWTTEAGRREQRAALDAAISAWTAEQDKFDVMRRLQAAGIPAGAVVNARELVEDPHLAARRFMVNAVAPEGGDFPMPGTPIRVDGRKRARFHAGPIRGEHNDSILKEVLRLDDAEISRLSADGILASAVLTPG